MSKLKIAIQKSGRLSQESLQLLEACGIKFPNGGGKLRTDATNFPMEVLFLRDDDIPQYVEQRVADIGIVGDNVLQESRSSIVVADRLGFSACRLSLAVPKDVRYPGLSYFNNKKIATSYPGILSSFLEQNKLHAQVEVLSGSVEIAPGIGLADGICDLVSSGSTLLSNGLKEVEQVMSSQAVLVRSNVLDAVKSKLLEKLLLRISAVRRARENKYILLNAPDDRLEQIAKILPGINSPTVLPLLREGWSSLHSVISEEKFWDIIDALREAGAEGILVVPIEKMIV